MVRPPLHKVTDIFRPHKRLQNFAKKNEIRSRHTGLRRPNQFYEKATHCLWQCARWTTWTRIHFSVVHALHPLWHVMLEHFTTVWTKRCRRPSSVSTVHTKYWRNSCGFVVIVAFATARKLFS